MIFKIIIVKNKKIIWYENIFRIMTGRVISVKNNFIYVSIILFLINIYLVKKSMFILKNIVI